jgi:hypothetical protein
MYVPGLISCDAPSCITGSSAGPDGAAGGELVVAVATVGDDPLDLDPEAAPLERPESANASKDTSGTRTPLAQRRPGC